MNVAAAATPPTPPAPPAVPPAAPRRPSIIDDTRWRDAVKQLAGARDGMLIVVPGTGSQELSGLPQAVAGALQAGGADVRVAVVPYKATVWEATKRFFGQSASGEEALVGALRELSKLPKRAPIWLVSESQGSWIVANSLKRLPTGLREVDRAVMASTPGFAPLPWAPGADPASGAALVDRAMRLTHEDDIVPALFTGVRWPHVDAIARVVASGLRGDGWNNPAHDYRPDAAAVAAYLKGGPAVAQHHSRTHR